MLDSFTTKQALMLSIATAVGSGRQGLDFLYVNVDNANATWVTLGNSHYADASLQSFATNHNPDNVTRYRQVALVKIQSGVILAILAANMTNVAVHGSSQKNS